MRMDTESAEERYQLEPVDHLTAETIFDARWHDVQLSQNVFRYSLEVFLAHPIGVLLFSHSRLTEAWPADANNM